VRQYTYFLSVLLLVSLSAGAVELRELAIEYKKYEGYTAFAELPDDQIKEEIAIEFDTHLGRCLNWHGRVHGSSTDAQFRWIGLEMSLECRDIFGWPVDVGAFHHSEHALDRSQPDDRHFPVKNWIGVKGYLYRAP
jgi:hypothetical protein